MTKTKFHPPHKTPTGHTFAINDDGTEIQLTFSDATSLEGDKVPTIVISGEDGKVLRSWLSSAELRSQVEADQLARDALAKPPREINPDTKFEPGAEPPAPAKPI